MNKKRKEFEEVIGRSPSLPELAHELGLSLEKVTLYQHLSHNVMSLERKLDEHSVEDKRTLGDLIACTEQPTPDEDAMSEAFRGEVHSMLDHLCDDERLVLTHRFGLEDGYPLTLREISEEMCVSIDIVRSIEAKALNKLRQPRMMYRLKDYVEDRSEEGWDGHSHHHHPILQHDHPIENRTIEGRHRNFVPHTMAAMEDMHHHMTFNGFPVDYHELGEDERPTPESIWSF